MLRLKLRRSASSRGEPTAEERALRAAYWTDAASVLRRRLDLTAALFLLSPFFLFMGASFMNHPPTLFFVSLDYFLPKTSHNLANYFGELEERHFPSLAKKHAIARAHSVMTWQRLKDSTQDARTGLESGVGRLVDRIQATTGLKLSDTLNSGHAASRKVVQEVQSKVVEELPKVEQPPDEKAEMKRLV